MKDPKDYTQQEVFDMVQQLIDTNYKPNMLIVSTHVDPVEAYYWINSDINVV